MYLQILSLGISILFNIFFLILLFTGFTLSIKRNEPIVISLLETLPEVPATYQTIPQNEPFPKQGEESFLREEHTVSGERRRETGPETRTVTKKETKKETRDEALLRDRLSTLRTGEKGKALQEREEDLAYLRERLSFLRERNSSVSRDAQAVSPGVRSEAPHPKGVLSENRLSAEYLFLVKRKLQTHFEIPIYLRNRPDLSALVEIEVRENGEIVRITFLRTSSDPAFNKAVENCLRAVNPLPVDRAVRLRIEFRSEGIGTIS